MSVPMSFVPERLAPVQGGPLKAADLRDLLALADHQRRRHVRALHDTWGIAAGLRIMFVNRPAVQAGVAYDRCGRLLVLASSVALPPAQQLPDRCVVVLRADLHAGEPAATLRFAAGADVELGSDIVLGVVERRSGGALAWSGEGRRHARTAAPVTLAAGRVPRGTVVATSFSGAGSGTPHGWSAWVDVRAGFEGTPVYVASVSAGRSSAAGAGATVHQAPARLGTASVEVSEPSPLGFRITVRRPASRGGPLDRTPITRTPDDITWIGALSQDPAEVRDPIPPAGPCTGPASEREHR